jgi:biopolymer transport protein ExbB
MSCLRAAAGLFIASLLLPGLVPAQEPTTLDELLKAARSGSSEARAINQKREAEFRSKKAEQQRLLNQAIATRDREEKRSERLEAEFGQNEIAIAQLEERLRNRLGSLGELFGVVRQVAGDTRGVLDASIASAQFTGRADRMGELAQTKELPHIEELEELWLTIQQEMTESGKVVRFPSTVVLPDGSQVQRDVVRVGVFNAISDGRFLQYLPETGKLTEIARQPARRHRSAAAELEAATEGLIAMPIDPSRGSILGLLVMTPTAGERIQQGGTIGYIIIGLGALGFVLVVIRFVSLMLVGRRMTAQLGSKTADTGNPLGRVMQVYEQHKRAGTETLELKLDESILRDRPALERGLTTIRVLSVIAPLLGLLGTVTGMIVVFQQITLFGAGDPKYMAGGIAQALVTTMLGLIMAIPLVFLHSVLRDRSKQLVQTLEEESAGMVARRAEEEDPT